MEIKIGEINLKESFPKSILNKFRRKISFKVYSNNNFSGMVHISDISKKHKGTISYWTKPEFRGRGIMSKAVKAISNELINKKILLRVQAYVLKSNKPSIKILKKAGYKKEGTLKKIKIKQGKAVDMEVYSRTSK